MVKKEKVSFEALGLSKTAEEYVGSFLSDYFAYTNEILDFEKTFIKNNNLTTTTKIDYTKLRRFLATALNNFAQLDSKFVSGLLQKLQLDVFALFDYINEFTQKTKVLDIVFNNEFLKTIDIYEKLLRQQEDAMSKRDRFESSYNSVKERIAVLSKQLSTQAAAIEYKKLKLELGDIAHNFALAKSEYESCFEKISTLKSALYPIFCSEFKRLREKYTVGLTEAASTKAYYLDKYMWACAQKNHTISNFLARANIDGDYDTKTYIKYYLKNINTESASDSEWHRYLKKVMELL